MIETFLQTDWLVVITKIVLATALGYLIGMERELHGKAVGTRTISLIAIGSALYVLMSPAITGGDNSRIIAQVVSGIGFLGAGVIMKQGLNIKGLTSAAIIWTDATIGLCIGAGLYIPTFILLALSLLSLVSLERIEERWFPAGRSKSLFLTYSSQKIDMARLTSLVESFGFLITDVNVSQIFQSNMTIIHYSVKAPKINDYSSFIQSLNEVGELTEFSVTD